MQVGFMMQKAVGELFILKSTKPLPIIFKSFCLPALLYGIEVTDPSKSVLRMLNNLINRAVYRIFNVSDKDSIADIRHFVGLHES